VLIKIIRVEIILEIKIFNYLNFHRIRVALCLFKAKIIFNNFVLTIIISNSSYYYFRYFIVKNTHPIDLYFRIYYFDNYHQIDFVNYLNHHIILE
jgi:hypothetical protein